MKDSFQDSLPEISTFNTNKDLHKSFQSGLSSAKSIFSSLKDQVSQKVQQHSNFLDSHGNQSLYPFTSRLYVCSFPSEGQKMDNLRNELNRRFDQNYKVYNLSPKKYNIAYFNNRCIDCSWQPRSDDNDAVIPNIAHLSKIVASIKRWLCENPRHVAVIHASSSPDRNCVLITSALLIAANLVSGPEQAIWYFSDKVFPPKQNLLSSQNRLLSNLSSVLASNSVPRYTNKFKLKSLSINSLPGFSRDKQTARPFLELYSGSDLRFTTFRDFNSTREYHQGSKIELDLGNAIMSATQPIRILVFHARQILGGHINIQKLNNLFIFGIQFDPSCVDDLENIDANHITLTSKDLDLSKENADRFPSDFSVDITLQMEKNHSQSDGREKPWEKIGKEESWLCSSSESREILQNYRDVPGMGVGTVLPITLLPQRKQKTNCSNPEKKEAKASFDPFSEQVSNGYNQVQQPTVDLLGFSAATETPKAATESNSIDLLGGFDEPPKPVNTTVNSTSNLTADLLGFDSTTPTPTNLTPSTTFDPFASWANSTPTVAKKADSFDPFASFAPDTSSVKSTTQTKPTSEPKQTTSKATTNLNTNTKKGNTFDDLLSEGFGFKKADNKPKTVGEAFKKQRDENLGDPIIAKIVNWTEGKENNIRALLLIF